MKIVKKIVVEKFNTSDVEYKLIEVNVKNYQRYWLVEIR